MSNEIEAPKVNILLVGHSERVLMPLYQALAANPNYNPRLLFQLRGAEEFASIVAEEQPQVLIVYVDALPDDPTGKAHMDAYRAKYNQHGRALIPAIAVATPDVNENSRQGMKHFGPLGFSRWHSTDAVTEALLETVKFLLDPPKSAAA